MNLLITFGLATLAQKLACPPPVQRVRSSIFGVVENFIMKILNLGVRRGRDVQLLMARLNSNSSAVLKLRRYIALTVDRDSSVGCGR